MNILLLGSGGREHALALQIARSSRCTNLFIAPGNPGMESLGRLLPEVKVNDFQGIETIVREQKIDLIVVGPEDPLVAGIVDYFRAIEELKSLPIVGPDASGARLEGSKDFSKAFMQRHQIPTARYQSFRQGQYNQAVSFLEQLHAPYVIKADGLAAGKGVIIASDLEEAKTELAEMLSGRFGEASHCVVIEEYLHGIECSVFIATDGKDYKILPVAKDYKRIGEGDTGLNTGGMGSVSPVCFADKVFMDKVEERIVRPTIQGLTTEGIDYRGFIFAGLMNVAGEPYVIEYNCRMGDPETESVMLRIESDFVDLLMGIATASLSPYELKIDPRTVATVVMVAAGYPESYPKGFEISLPTELPFEGVIYHSGTTKVEDKICTSGGRVLTATCYGETLQQALEHCYHTISLIEYQGKTFRSDIGKDLIALGQ